MKSVVCVVLLCLFSFALSNKDKDPLEVFSDLNSSSICLTNVTQIAREILSTAPVFDGHNDLPWQYRDQWEQRVYNNSVDIAGTNTGNLHTNIPFLREGQVGAQFWSVFVNCSMQVGCSGFRFTMEINFAYSE